MKGITNIIPESLEQIQELHVSLDTTPVSDSDVVKAVFDLFEADDKLEVVNLLVDADAVTTGSVLAGADLLVQRPVGFASPYTTGKSYGAGVVTDATTLQTSEQNVVLQKIDSAGTPMYLAQPITYSPFLSKNISLSSTATTVKGALAEVLAGVQNPQLVKILSYNKSGLTFDNSDVVTSEGKDVFIGVVTKSVYSQPTMSDAPIFIGKYIRQEDATGGDTGKIKVYEFESMYDNPAGSAVASYANITEIGGTVKTVVDTLAVTTAQTHDGFGQLLLDTFSANADLEELFVRNEYTSAITLDSDSAGTETGVFTIPSKATARITKGISPAAHILYLDVEVFGEATDADQLKKFAKFLIDDTTTAGTLDDLSVDDIAEIHIGELPRVFTLNNQTITFTNKAATISDTRVTADSLVEVYYADASMSVASAAGISVESASGAINFTADADPTSALVATIKVTNPR